MPRKIGDAFVAVRPQVEPGFQGDLEKGLTGPSETAGKKAGKKFGGGFSSGLGTVVKTIGATFLGLRAIDVFKGFVSEATESITVGRQTAAVIKSTGGAARISADQVGALSTAISNKIGVDDEAIQTGANLLLTFTNIRNEAGKGNDIFNQTTNVLADMTSAMNHGVVNADTLKSSSIQLGKALNDPLKGITALTRVGVTFNDQQKKQIASFVKSGNIIGAQKIILAELTKEFGGSAAAVATPGQKMSVAWSNLQETVGLKLMPTLNKLIDRVTAILPQVLAVGSAVFNWAYHSTAVQTAIKSLVVVVGALWVVLKATIGFVQDHQTVFSTIAVAILAIVAAMTIWNVITKVVAIGQAILNAVMYANPIGLIILAIVALVAAFAYLWTHSEAFRKFWIGLWNAIWGFLKAVGAWFAGPFANFFILAWRLISGSAQRFWNDLKGIWNAIWSFIKGIGHWFSTTLPGFFSSAWNKMKAELLALTVWVYSRIDAFVAFWKGIPHKISTAVSGMWDGIKSAFRAVINWIIGAWNSLHFRVPSIDTHIPGIGKIGGFDIGVPQLPYMATGGKVWRAGVVAMNEAGAGAELVDLPAGATVSSPEQTGEIVELLRRLIEVADGIAPGVGRALMGAQAGALVQARAR
jgi:hypothetical protein